MIYGIYAEKIKTVLMFYLVLYVFIAVSLGKTMPSISLQSLKYFALMFILTSIILIPLTLIQQVSAEVVVTTAISFGFFHAFVKAFIEERIWGDGLKSRIGKPLNALTFGLFHLAVTFTTAGVNLIAIGVLMILRFVWDNIHDRYGVMGSTGSHFAYNAFVMGFEIL